MSGQWSIFNKYYYKNVTRTSSNGSSLLKYQKYVENINYYEWKAIGGTLTTIGMSWLAFILSVPTAGAGTLTAGLAALGAYGATLDSLLKIHQNAKLARGIYFNL
ncbi:geobacillin-26 family protein [Bacillus sp. FJAT-47783]|uniref:geobacillin-26 family protein n=1 Tax=Bacillus sp. FJAT-47783 TaxID=2922712 RepID=UPI001FADA943|nr:geobacillin-26 family protein [Bacillus sp. FJAT-47783]